MKIIFSNGCFDCMHPDHIDLLRYCKSLGGWVVIGLNSDESIKRLKGKDRPFHDQYFRKTMLEAIRYVDCVEIFEEDTPLELIKKIKPDIIVKGGDYTPETVVGNELAEVRIYRTSGKYSTTEIIQDFNNRRNV